MVELVLSRMDTPYVLCADGGALNAVKLGYTPQTIIGDLDSLTSDQLLEFEAKGISIIRHPAEKDETDLELALYWCIEHDAKRIIIVGGLGGRFDQTLANIYLLSLPELQNIHIEVVEDNQSIQLLRPGEHQVYGHVGDTISLIPIGDRVQGITTTALKYPLKNEDLLLGPARGVSNVMNRDQAAVSIRDGLLLLVHTIGRA